VQADQRKFRGYRASAMRLPLRSDYRMRDSRGGGGEGGGGARGFPSSRGEEPRVFPTKKREKPRDAMRNANSNECHSRGSVSVIKLRGSSPIIVLSIYRTTGHRISTTTLLTRPDARRPVVNLYANQRLASASSRFANGGCHVEH